MPRGTGSAVLGLGHGPACEVSVISSGCKSVSSRPLSPCTKSAATAILQIYVPNTLGVQVLTICSALLGYTSRLVEQAARHLCPPPLSCVQQVGEPATDVTRLTPNDVRLER